MINVKIIDMTAHAGQSPNLVTSFNRLHWVILLQLGKSFEENDGLVKTQVGSGLHYLLEVEV